MNCKSKTFKTLTTNNVILVGGLILLGFLAYFNVLSTDFIGDDVGRIRGREYLFSKGLFAIFSDFLPDRPFLMFTLWINYIFRGMEVFSFKLTNLILHCLTGISLFFLFKKIFENFKNNSIISFFVAGLFLVHPLNNQAVNSIIQRGVILSALFSFISILFFINYLSKRKLFDYEKTARIYYLLSVMFFVLAVLSKPNTITFPLLLLIIGYFVSELNLLKTIKLIAPFLLVLLIPLFYYFIAQENVQSSVLNPYQYFLIQSKVIIFYFYKYVLPLDLSFHYFIKTPLEQYVDYWVVPALICHICLFGLSFFAFLKNKSVVGMLVILGYVLYLPESSFFSINYLAFDHRNYLPMPFFLGAIAAFCEPLFKRQVFILALGAVVLAFGTLNVMYTKRISTTEKWISYNLEKHPNLKPMYTYFIAEELKAQNYAAAQRIIYQSQKNNPNDGELKILQKVASYDRKSQSEKLEFLSLLITESIQNNYSEYMFKFTEFFISKYIFDVLPKKEALYKLNFFYFTFLDRFTKSDTNEFENIERIFNNFMAVIKMNNREAPNINNFFDSIEIIDALIVLRNLIALKYYFGISFDEYPYIELIQSKHSNIELSQQIINWHKNLASVEQVYK